VYPNFLKHFELLIAIYQVVEQLGLSFHNVRALHQKIDALPDKAGEWQTKSLSFRDLPGETFTIRHRDPIEAIKSLWRDPNLSPHMVFAPSKVYSDATKSDRIYSEMWTGQWWHALQVRDTIVIRVITFKLNFFQSHVKPGGTVAPILVSTDKTKLTQFVGGKTAYPVYMTVGNIPKKIRRKPSEHACVLIAYLSVDKIDRSQMSEQEHRTRIQKVFHEAMRVVLEPLIDAGKNGVEMISSDGSIRDVFPFLSCYAADYPEQCLVSCTKYGTCPKCCAKATELGAVQPAEAHTVAWTTSIIDKARKHAETYDGSARVHREFHTNCMSHDVAGTICRPFWTGFPLCDIHQAIVPDILHQLHQGVFKHLVEWCQQAVGASHLDARIRTLPPSNGVRHFKNGISALSQVSGTERKNIEKVLLGCLIGIMPKGGILAVAALLDFIYLAQYSAHNTTTLGYLEDALKRFHTHQDYFIRLGVRSDFNIPKFHSLLHYVNAIKLFGTTDNYNTELFERLHIDFSKSGWRASNHRDEFPQMIRWLSRREKIALFEGYMKSRSMSGSQPDPSTDTPMPPPDAIPDNSLTKTITIAKHPAFPKSPITIVQQRHNAPDFDYYLKVYINDLQTTPIPHRQLDNHTLPFTRVNVYNQFRLHPISIHDDDTDCPNIVKALRKSHTHPYGRFDTVVGLLDNRAESTGLEGQC